MDTPLIQILPNFAQGIGNDAYTITFTVMALLLAIIWHNFLLVIVHKVREMVLSSDLRTFEAENANSGFRMRIILSTIHLLSISIFIDHILKQFGVDIVEYWYILGLLFLLHAFRILMTRFLSYVFSMVEMYHVWVESYSWIHYILGLLVFPLAVLMTYSPVVTFSACANIALVIYLLSKILLFYRLFVVFYNGIHSLFYLFLYLCTLEIIPLLIVFHYIV